MEGSVGDYKTVAGIIRPANGDSICLKLILRKINHHSVLTEECFLDCPRPRWPAWHSGAPKVPKLWKPVACQPGRPRWFASWNSPMRAFDRAWWWFRKS